VHPFHERHRQRVNDRLRRATSDLAGRVTAGDTSDPVLQDWLGFACGLTTGAIAEALRAASAGFASDPQPHAAPGEPRVTAPGEIVTWPETASLKQMRTTVPLVPLLMPPQRLELAYNGARRFRFRTTAAAILSCAIRPVQHAVAEDGVPLTRVVDFDQIAPGTYAANRDEILFRASDSSDPRTNGRRYTVLVPAAAAMLEELPLQQILDRDL
jgi:hypothetical protein